MGGALKSVFGGSGGIFGAVLGVASMFFPPLAVAGSLSNLLTSAIGQAVNMAVSQLVQQGMPKFLAGIVSELVDKAVSSVQKESTPEVDQHVQENAGSAIQSFRDNLASEIVNSTIQAKGKSDKKGSGSWLEALAKALGAALDAQAKTVEDLSSTITDKNAKDKPSTMLELQTASQRMSFMMQAADQVVKTLGEALSTAARK